MLFLAEEEQNPLLPSTPDIIWSLVVLIIIGIVIGKFAVPKFLKILDERTELIEGGIERAEKAQVDAQNTLRKYQELLDEARNEAARIREEGRIEGQTVLTQMRNQAVSESERIVASGKQELEILRGQIIAELRTDLSKNSIILAEKLLGHELSSETKQAETINRFINEIELAG